MKRNLYRKLLRGASEIGGQIIKGATCKSELYRTVTEADQEWEASNSCFACVEGAGICMRV